MYIYMLSTTLNSACNPNLPCNTRFVTVSTSVHVPKAFTDQSQCLVCNLSHVCVWLHVYGDAEPVGYDGGACYLAEEGSVTELRSRPPPPAPPARVAALGAMRARHASDGDILAPPHRPESGAFSGDRCSCCITVECSSPSL